MSLFSPFLNKKVKETHTVEFSKEELAEIQGVPITSGDEFNKIASKKSIYEQNSMYIQGVASYFVSKKNYPLAEKLFVLAQSAANNAIELHFAYNLIIDVLYKQRSDPEKLNSCIEFCKRDIELYPQFDKENQAKYGNNDKLHIPAFERLAIIYEKSGDYENAIKVNELALSYPNLSKHDAYQNRIDKLKLKL